jgi:hypothetical protein
LVIFFHWPILPRFLAPLLPIWRFFECPRPPF